MSPPNQGKDRWNFLKTALEILRIPESIRTRISLIALAILVVFLVIIFITPATEAYRLYIILGLMAFSIGIVFLISRQPALREEAPVPEHLRVIELSQEVEFITELIRKAKRVDLICSSSISFFDTYSNVIKEAKPQTRIFLRKWPPGYEYLRERVTWYRGQWDALNRSAERAFVSTNLHSNDTLRGFVITQPDRTYGILGFYIWKGPDNKMTELKSTPHAMCVTDKTKLGEYLIRTYTNRLDKIASPFYQVRIVLDDEYLNSDCMSPEFIQGTFLHCERVYRWILTLKPGASDALQIAGLVHDIDRAYEDKRVKQSDYDDYNIYKREHAARSAEIVEGLLEKAGTDPGLIERVRYLVQEHEAVPTGDPELEILKAADSLTFFDFDLDRYRETSGAEATKRKMAFMYNKLSRQYKGEIDRVMQSKSGQMQDLFESAKM